MDVRDIQFFDPNEDVTVAWKTLPHWAQAGALCFITWRTADSLPLAAQERISRERTTILKRFGLEPHGDWQSSLFNSWGSRAR
jgi:type I restriction enzyme R subunit